VTDGSGTPDHPTYRGLLLARRAVTARLSHGRSEPRAGTVLTAGGSVSSLSPTWPQPVNYALTETH
jgi:hypothetical protein